MKAPAAEAAGAGRTRRQPTFSLAQYHRRRLLDDRVRNGNGYGQAPMGTGNALDPRARAEDTPTRGGIELEGR